MDIVQKAKSILTRILFFILGSSGLMFGIVLRDEAKADGILFYYLFIVISLVLFIISIIGPEKVHNFYKKTKIYNYLTPRELTQEDIKKIKDKENEREKRIAIFFGKIFRPIFLIFLAIITYHYIPDILNRPLSVLTLNEIFRFIISIIVIIGAIFGLLGGYPDDDEYAFWGYLSYLALFLGVSIIIFFFVAL